MSFNKGVVTATGLLPAGFPLDAPWPRDQRPDSGRARWTLLQPRPQAGRHQGHQVGPTLLQKLRGFVKCTFHAHSCRKPTDPRVGSLTGDLLWSDPVSRPGVSASARGIGVFFGPDVTRRFLGGGEHKHFMRARVRTTFSSNLRQQRPVVPGPEPLRDQGGLRAQPRRLLHRLLRTKRRQGRQGGRAHRGRKLPGERRVRRWGRG